MKRENNIETAQFDRAVSDAFQSAPDCGAFGAFDDLSRRRMMNEILDLAAKAPSPADVDTGVRRRPVRVLAMGAAAAVIMSLAGLWGFGVLSSTSRETSASRPTYFGEVQNLRGALYFDESPAAINDPVPVDKSIRTAQSTALLRLPTGISWQMESHSQGEIAPLTVNRLQVTVRSGESWFRVDPARKGPAFSVMTPMGRIDVTGTVFVVNADPSDVRVTLLKGKVQVTDSAGNTYWVAAGHVMHLREQTQYALPLDAQRRMQERLVELFGSTEKATVATNSDGTPADGMDTEARPDKVDADDAPPRHPPAAGRTSHQLLAEIQRQRRARNWGKVAGLYKRLIQSAPGSETAVVSRVSLGEIYLSKLQQYKDALFHFDKYLQSGHTALLPEASYGRCSALKAMGNREREIQCLDGFIKRFAGAFQAPKARARLEVLRSRDRI